MEYLRKGFPSNRAQLPANVPVFWNARLHLSERNDQVFFGERVVIPKALKQAVLDGLHLAQQGVTAMILLEQN